MESDDDFGDDFDDTAFLEAATQAEKENTPPESPRPLKRRKIDLPNEKTGPSPPRKHVRNRRPRPFVSSDEDDEEDDDDVDDEGIESAPVATRRNRASTEHDDDGDDSIAPTGVASMTRKKRAAKAKRRRKQSRERVSTQSWCCREASKQNPPAFSCP
jgi:hypothetical protein